MADVPAEATPSWFEVADELIDEGVDREEAVTLEAEGVTVDVPLSFAEGDFARWQFDGEVTVTVDGMRRPLAEWDYVFRQSPRDRSEQERSSTTEE